PAPCPILKIWSATSAWKVPSGTFDRHGKQPVKPERTGWTGLPRALDRCGRNSIMGDFCSQPLGDSTHAKRAFFVLSTADRARNGYVISATIP
ncbi:hypothetical protein, partial [Methylobacterium platani]|uniref:hypothetical protein n=1 Tax=Methylobacterium platani TaxID=427683 RepID=UPI001AE02B1D